MCRANWTGGVIRRLRLRSPPTPWRGRRRRRRRLDDPAGPGIRRQAWSAGVARRDGQTGRPGPARPGPGEARPKPGRAC
jgi:hypothetical protein